MTRTETIIRNAFALPHLATKIEAEVGRAMLRSEWGAKDAGSGWYDGRNRSGGSMTSERSDEVRDGILKALREGDQTASSLRLALKTSDTAIKRVAGEMIEQGLVVSYAGRRGSTPCTLYRLVEKPMEAAE